MQSGGLLFQPETSANQLLNAAVMCTLSLSLQVIVPQPLCAYLVPLRCRLENRLLIRVYYQVGKEGHP